MNIANQKICKGWKSLTSACYDIRRKSSDILLISV
jgi:hypothetical protein